MAGAGEVARRIMPGRLLLKQQTTSKLCSEQQVGEMARDRLLSRYSRPNCFIRWRRMLRLIPKRWAACT
jgi:hypothetical protein